MQNAKNIISTAALAAGLLSTGTWAQNSNTPRTAEDFGALSIGGIPSTVQQRVWDVSQKAGSDSSTPMNHITPATLQLDSTYVVPMGGAQSKIDPKVSVTDGFMAAFGRAPSREELDAWVDFRVKYPMSTLAETPDSLAYTLSYALKNPNAAPIRREIAQRALRDGGRRRANAGELDELENWMTKNTFAYNELVANVRTGGMFARVNR